MYHYNIEQKARTKFRSSTIEFGNVDVMYEKERMSWFFG
jgi:hypothetical protein